MKVGCMGGKQEEGAVVEASGMEGPSVVLPV